MILPLDSKLEPWITAEILAKIEADEGWMADETVRCEEEPWYWAVNYIYTIRKDEFTENSRPEVLRFPPKEHLRYLLHKCFTEPKFVNDKSRQMVLSWLFMLYELYWGQFGKYEEIVVQTKKEADVEQLVWRAKFMYDSQRYWMKKRFPVDYRGGRGGRLEFMNNHCVIQGIPGGVGAGDQIRSKNPSRYFLDEGAFIDEFEDCRTNAEACCQDIKIVSTAGAGQFCEFVHDRLMV